MARQSSKILKSLKNLENKNHQYKKRKKMIINSFQLGQKGSKVNKTSNNKIL